MVHGRRHCRRMEAVVVRNIVRRKMHVRRLKAAARVRRILLRRHSRHARLPFQHVRLPGSGIQRQTTIVHAAIRARQAVGVR